MTKKVLVPLVLPADPTAALEAATKQYVDARAGSEVEISTTDPIGTNPNAELWYDSDAPDPSPTYPQATTAATGVVELATLAEANARTDAIRAVTPASAADWPRGVVAWKKGIHLGAALGAGSTTTAWSLSAPLVAGRLYRLEFGYRAAIITSGATPNVLRHYAPAIANVTMEVDTHHMINSAAHSHAYVYSMVRTTVTATYTLVIQYIAGPATTVYDEQDYITLTDVGVPPTIQT